MNVPTSSKGDKFFLLLMNILLFILLINSFLDFRTQNSLANFVVMFLSAILLIMVILGTIFAFATYEINNNGITFKSLIYRKVCKWSDFKFIAKYNIKYPQKYIQTAKIGFICSYKLEKENLKRFHATCNYSIKYFNISYFDEFEDYILTYASNIYTGLIIDDSKSG